MWIVIFLFLWTSLASAQSIPFPGFTTGGGGPPPAFACTDISGCVLWVKADAGVYVDSGTTPAVDGDPVRQWNDQSGNANHLSSASSSNRPIFKTSIVNGLPVVRFSADTLRVMDVVPAGGISIGTSYSAFVVFQVTSTSSPGSSAYKTLYTNADGTAGLFWLNNSGSPKLNAYFSGDHLSSTTLSTSTFYLVAEIVSGGSGTHYLNNAADGTYSSMPSWVLHLVGNDGFGDILNGDIAEMIFYNSALNSTDRGTVKTYLCGRFAFSCS